jgi:hypothetical protein
MTLAWRALQIVLWLAMVTVSGTAGPVCEHWPMHDGPGHGPDAQFAALQKHMCC